MDVNIDSSIKDPMEDKIDNIVLNHAIDSFHNLNGFASHGEIVDNDIQNDITKDNRIGDPKLDKILDQFRVFDCNEHPTL